MKRIEFDEPGHDEWKKWRARCAKEVKRYDKAIAAGERYKVKDSLYKAQKALFVDASGPFGGRCAYCESDLSSQHGDIEHYRPKNAVEHEDRTTVSRVVGESEEAHPGYQWLAYDWTNLLLSCVLCNQLSAGADGGAHGKGNRFPVDGEHAWSPADVEFEAPKLINPVTEDPRDHLEIDLDNGLLTAKTERGRATIEILGLNLRSLPDNRMRAISDLRARMRLALASADTTEQRTQLLTRYKSELNDRPFASTQQLAFQSEINGYLESLQAVAA